MRPEGRSGGESVAPADEDGVIEERVIRLLRRGPHTIEDLANALDRGPGTVRSLVDELRDGGLEIHETPYGGFEIPKGLPSGPMTSSPVSHATQAESTFKIALISDTHLCSTHQQLTALRQFYRIARDEGAKRVYNSGDVIAGEGVYRGQQYDLFLVGHDRQTDYAIEHYPDELPTTFITGNHDLAYLSRIGIDPGRTIARERSDMEYVGQWVRRVEVAPGIYLDLTHGSGGVAYAVSYKLQKAIESYAPGDEPHILSDGHYHIMLKMFRRGIWTYHPGCFEGQTGLLRRLKLHPVIGGWILTIHVEQPGRIGAIESRFYQFEELEKDY